MNTLCSNFPTVPTFLVPTFSGKTQLEKIHLMPSSHLACDGSTEPVSCPYPLFRGGRRRLLGFHMDSRAPWPLRFCLAGSYTNLKNHKSVARRHVIGGISQSQHRHRAETARSKTAWWRHGHRTISAQPLHGSCAGSAQLPSGGCGDCTATPLRLHDFRTIFAQPLCGFTPAFPPPPRVSAYKKSHDARRQCEHIRHSP